MQDTGVCTQDENAALECEKQELIAAHLDKELKMNKLTDLVISAGANMSMEQAAAAHARKVKATARQSWCPGALSGSGGMGAMKGMGGGFGAFPSKAPTNKLALATGIEEGDESVADWEQQADKRKSSDSSMSLCSVPDDASAIEVVRLQAVIAALQLELHNTAAPDNAVHLEQLAMEMEALRFQPLPAFLCMVWHSVCMLHTCAMYALHHDGSHCWHSCFTKLLDQDTQCTWFALDRCKYGVRPLDTSRGVTPLLVFCLHL